MLVPEPLRVEDMTPEVVPLVLRDAVKEDDGVLVGEMLDVIVAVFDTDEVAQPETDEDRVGETLAVVEIEYDTVPVGESEPVRLSDVVTLTVVESVPVTLFDDETLSVVEDVPDTQCDDETLAVTVSVEVGDREGDSLDVVVLDDDGIIIDTVEAIVDEDTTVFVNPGVTVFAREIVCREEIVDLPDGETSALEGDIETDIDAELVLESCCVIDAAFETAGDEDGV